jgi:alpha-glucosidase
MRHWWEEAVFYQIYPRSFADSNGDGIGDLPGITSRIDYLAGLGVNALWISPFFTSPMKDFGYDVSDYRGVDRIFGRLEDFTALATKAKARGIRIVLDLVANHSSAEHPWFVEARSSKENPRHPWYLWVPDTGRPPNNWKAIFELGTAWHRNPATGERYLGTFTRHQPEFDWRVREVREAFYDIMRYWFDLGVDGFRLDVATAYLKDEKLRSNPFAFNVIPDFFQRHIYDRNRPEVHEIFKELRAVADASSREGEEKVLIGETHGSDVKLAASCHGEHGDELHMAFNFDFLHRPWKASAFRRSAENWYAQLPGGAWPNFTLSNHDQPRHAWRYRASSPALTDARARVAAAMLLTLRGTPFLYYGEELGMSCYRIPRKRLVDPIGVLTWPKGFIGRDPERTPMQWDASENSGFGSGNPWLPVNPDYPKRNVAAQDADPKSILSWYRGLIALRGSKQALRSGAIRFLDLNAEVLAYERSLGSETIVVLLNFASGAKTVSLDKRWILLYGSDRVAGSELAGSLRLAPGEVAIAEAK